MTSRIWAQDCGAAAPNLTFTKEEILATLWYAENYVQLIEGVIATGPHELRWLQELLNMRAERADEQVKGINKMMVYRNLLIHATLGYKKKQGILYRLYQ